MSFGCFSCKGSGAIVATHRKTGYIYAFKCSCNSYPDRNKNYPLWLSKHGHKYKADFIDSPPPDPRQAAADQITIKPRHAEPIQNDTKLKKVAEIEAKELTITEDDVPF